MGTWRLSPFFAYVACTVIVRLWKSTSSHTRDSKLGVWHSEEGQGGSALIQHINHLPQTTEVDTVKPEEHTRQVRDLIEVVARRLCHYNLALAQDIAKITIQAGEHTSGRQPLQADEQLAIDVTGRMVIAVEGGNFLHRLIQVAGDFEQMQITWRNKARWQHMMPDKGIPVVPIRAFRGVN